MTTKRLLVAVVVALGLTWLGLTAPAVAKGPPDHAGPDKGTVTVTAPLLALAPLLDIEVSATGLATQKDADTFVFPVVGNTEATGRIFQIGGLELSKPDGSTLTISNYHLDIETLVVTAVINDEERVPVFRATRLDENTVQLAFTEEGAAIVSSFVDFLGLPNPGDVFGTATAHLSG